MGSRKEEYSGEYKGDGEEDLNKKKMNTRKMKGLDDNEWKGKLKGQKTKHERKEQDNE